MNKDKPRRPQLRIRVDPHQLESLKRMARDEHRTLSELARNVLDIGLAKHAYARLRARLRQ